MGVGAVNKGSKGPGARTPSGVWSDYSAASDQRYLQVSFLASLSAFIFS